MASIQQQPSGKWRARYEDTEGNERARHFDTKGAAEDFLATVRVQMRDGTWVDPMAGRRTFSGFAWEWLDGRVRLRKSSRDQKAQLIRNHLEPAFGDRSLVSIQKADVQAFIRAQTAKKLAPATIEGHYTLLAQIFIAAVDEHLLAQSPCWKIELPEPDEARVVIPTVEQVAAVYSEAPDHAKALVLFAAGTGMRVSEVAGLTIDRVDFLRRTVTVDRQMVGSAAGLPRFGPPKTKAGFRTIPVPAEITDALAARLATHPSPNVVFRNSHGGLWRRQSLLEEWRRWRGAADQTFPFRGLRHHYASALIAAGQSVKVVQERLGHKSATTTLDIYGHLFPGDEDATRTVVSGLIGDLSRTADGLLARKSRSQA